MLSRREMGALCASLLFCLLLSLGAGWAQSQLTTADQLAADTLRLHIRADTDSVRDQSAKLAVRDAVLALTDEACPADSRADARAWAGLCRSACGGYDTPAENDLVCGEYIVRFRFVEWWDGLTAPREDVVLAG